MVSRRHMARQAAAIYKQAAPAGCKEQLRRLPATAAAGCRQQQAAAISSRMHVGAAAGCNEQHSSNAAARCEQQHQQDASNSISMQAGSRNKLWSKHKLQTRGSRLHARTATGCKQQQQRAASKNGSRSMQQHQQVASRQPHRLQQQHQQAVDSSGYSSSSSCMREAAAGCKQAAAPAGVKRGGSKLQQAASAGCRQTA